MYMLCVCMSVRVCECVCAFMDDVLRSWSFVLMVYNERLLLLFFFLLFYGWWLFLFYLFDYLLLLFNMGRAGVRIVFFFMIW